MPPCWCVVWARGTLGSRGCGHRHHLNMRLLTRRFLCSSDYRANRLRSSHPASVGRAAPVGFALRGRQMPVDWSSFCRGIGKRWGRYHTAAICCLILWPWPWASFARDGSRMFGAGVNFSSKAQTIDEWIIQGHDLSSDEAIQRVVAFAEMGGLGLIVDTPWSPIMRKPIGRLDA